MELAHQFLDTLLAIVIGVILVFVSESVREWLRERKDKRDLINRLWSDFNSNKDYLEKYKKVVNEASLFTKWTDLNSKFVGFIDIGWTAFKVKGGTQYLDKRSYLDTPFYVTIDKYYTKQYQLHHEINNNIEEGIKNPSHHLSSFLKGIKDDIDNLCDENKKIWEKLNHLRTSGWERLKQEINRYSHKRSNT